MKYEPRKFDNSQDEIDFLEHHHKEAQEFVYGWMQDKGFFTEDHCLTGLDFDDIFSVMTDYLQQTHKEFFTNKPCIGKESKCV